jgi:hypothetical protein
MPPDLTLYAGQTPEFDEFPYGFHEHPFVMTGALLMKAMYNMG